MTLMQDATPPATPTNFAFTLLWKSSDERPQNCQSPKKDELWWNRYKKVEISHREGYYSNREELRLKVNNILLES